MGHISPILSIIPILKEQEMEISCWIGVSDMEKNCSLKNNISFKKIAACHFRNIFSYRTLFFPFLFLAGLFKTCLIFIKHKPDYVFGTGTYACFPVVLSAKLFRSKIIIHEQTAGFGLANKVYSLFANKILISFEESLKYLPNIFHKKCFLVGNPIRKDLLVIEEDVVSLFGHSSLPMLYISGGSIGRLDFNKFVQDSYEDICKFWVVVYHRGNMPPTGIVHENLFEFSDVSSYLASIYRSTDFVITSCGANTLNELNFFKLPALLVPLKISRNNEQIKNAQHFVSGNKGSVLLKYRISTGSVLEILNKKNIELRRENLMRNRLINLSYVNDIAFKIVKSILKT